MCSITVKELVESGGIIMSGIILNIKNVRKSFTGVQVLHGLNFDLRKGEVLGLVGENGAGKSTLMNINWRCPSHGFGEHGTGR